MNTTVNLGLRPLTIINNCAKRLGIEPSLILYRCLRKKIAKLAKEPFSFVRNAVKYQERFADTYFIVHVQFDWDFYDTNLLSRFVRKRSVSLILAQAINEFANEVEQEILKNATKSDNYPWFSITIRQNNEYPSLLWDISQNIIEQPPKT